MKKIPDAKFEELKASMNAAIHEVVFACAHLEQDELDDAAQGLMTAQDTLDRVAEAIALVAEE